MLKTECISVGALDENCYILFDDCSKNAIIIDPGADYIKIQNFLIKKNLQAKAILLTHGHFDHIGAVNDFSAFNIPVYIHVKDADKLANADKNLSKSFGLKINNCSANMIFSGEEFEFSVAGFDILAIHTPGHSKGSVCYKIENFLFTGDTLFKNGYGRTDFYDGSFEELKNSLRKLKNYITKQTIVLPGH